MCEWTPVSWLVGPSLSPHPRLLSSFSPPRNSPGTFPQVARERERRQGTAKAIFSAKAPLLSPPPAPLFLLRFLIMMRVPLSPLSLPPTYDYPPIYRTTIFLLPPPPTPTHARPNPEAPFLPPPSLHLSNRREKVIKSRPPPDALENSAPHPPQPSKAGR